MIKTMSYLTSQASGRLVYLPSQKRCPGHRAASALRRYSMGNYDNFIKL